ncbi:hypothetical protein CGZ92_08400 [Parenemella sanctibonifatiensis]|uniref:Uncharacterized protein n=2 Tax=Parenemella sanctibonifatiensis TaxID=2016505 RepID=A0A255E4A1_9ACTN|nr:hypothetical protein CGZ92_08400 [Parenemella sanctibonifatiensis]
MGAAGQRYGISLLPGQGVTTHRGHANAFGEIGFVDFREPVATWIEQVEKAGGVLSANHPLSQDCAWLPEELPPVLELWHIEWFLGLHHTAPWTLLWRWPAGTPVIGGSDFHTPSQGYPPGTPTTWVLASECTTEALLEGVRLGRTAISRSPTPDCPVLLRLADQLWAVDADGCVLVDQKDRRRVIHGDRVRLPAPAGRCRLEAADRGLLAIA